MRSRILPDLVQYRWRCQNPQCLREGIMTDWIGPNLGDVIHAGGDDPKYGRCPFCHHNGLLILDRSDLSAPVS
jgi:hypothetical protein